LLSAGCDKDAKDKDGDNLLIHVCRNGHLDACKMLIEVVGCDKEVKNNNGKNAFLLSSQYGRLDVCKYLIDSGVETSATDNRRYTALHLASQSNKFDIVRLLVNYDCEELI
jgi:ankyrin repeat protein